MSRWFMLSDASMTTTRKRITPRRTAAPSPNDPCGAAVMHLISAMQNARQSPVILPPSNYRLTNPQMATAFLSSADSGTCGSCVFLSVGRRKKLACWGDLGGTRGRAGDDQAELPRPCVLLQKISELHSCDPSPALNFRHGTRAELQPSPPARANGLAGCSPSLFRERRWSWRSSSTHLP